MAQNWSTLRGAAQFTDINWSATTGFGGPTVAATTQVATPAPTATTAAPATPPSRAALPASAPPPTGPGAQTGTWVGTLETYPSFLRLTFDLPAATNPTAPVQGTLRIELGAALEARVRDRDRYRDPLIRATGLVLFSASGGRNCVR